MNYFTYVLCKLERYRLALTLHGKELDVNQALVNSNQTFAKYFVHSRTTYAIRPAHTKNGSARQEAKSN